MLPKRDVYACERCDEADISPNVEAYEETGLLVCDDCAAEILEGREES